MKIYKFLAQVEFTKGDRFANLEAIRDILSKSRTLTLETEGSRTYAFLDDDDFYNEFGVEIREEYFKNTYSTEALSLKSDT